MENIEQLCIFPIVLRDYLIPGKISGEYEGCDKVSCPKSIYSAFSPLQTVAVLTLSVWDISCKCLQLFIVKNLDPSCIFFYLQYYHIYYSIFRTTIVLLLVIGRFHILYWHSKIFQRHCVQVLNSYNIRRRKFLFWHWRLCCFCFIFLKNN